MLTQHWDSIETTLTLVAVALTSPRPISVESGVPSFLKTVGLDNMLVHRTAGIAATAKKKFIPYYVNSI